MAVGDVPTKLEFVLPTSKVNIRVVAHGAEANTGKHEEKDVIIHDARNERSKYTMETAGFELVDHPTKVTDFHDKDQIDNVYIPEIKALLKQLMGADEVSCFGPYLRRTGAVAGEDYQPPGIGAHLDFAPHTAEQMARDHAPSPDYTYSRFACVNVWRALSEPPQDWPLAVCDGRSVPFDAGVFNALYHVEKIPDLDRLKQINPPNPGGHIFQYDPKLQWHFFSNMTQDEALCFKIFDSNRHQGFRVPHAAFFDTTRPESKPRSSYEIRTVCYFK